MKIIGTCLILLGISGFAYSQAAPKVNENLLRKEMTQLKDPESAQFRDVKFKNAGDPESWHMCGYVNAKNAFGGYVGFTRFSGMLFVKKGKPHYYLVVSVEDAVANQMCAKNGM